MSGEMENEIDPRVHAVEMLISTLLRIGVVTSLSIVAIGTMMSFAHHPDYRSSPAELHRLTTPGAAFPHSISGVIVGLRERRGQSIVMVGLLLLIATPVMRVAVSIMAFVYQEDWVFSVLTAIVLSLLILSFFLGKAGG